MLRVDSRELAVKDGVLDYFDSKGIEAVEETMLYGDYRMEITRDDGSEVVVVVERKTPGDFIQSTTATIKEPATKLARQINGCIDSGADIVVLLLDGQFYPQRSGKMRAGKITLRHPFTAFASKLRTIQSHQVRVEFNPAEWFLPQYLLSLYEYETRSEHKTLALTPKALAVPSREAAKWTVLMGIKGVGPQTAQALLTQFGSVAAVATADAKSLTQVKGIGKVTAERILWYLN